MGLLARLFPLKRQKNQQQVACRAAVVVGHVIFDVGVDNFVNGTMLLDRRFRVRFVGGGAPLPAREIIAAVALCELAEARTLRATVDEAALDQATLELHTGAIVNGLMRELREQSAALRALP
jgi:hypothetical protein